MSRFDWINQTYNLKVKNGMAVAYEGKIGTVTGSTGQYVMVKLNGEKHSDSYHPTDLEYN